MDGRVQGWMEEWMDKQVGIQVEILFTCLICGLPLILEISPLFQISFVTFSFSFLLVFQYISNTIQNCLRILTCSVSFLKFPVEFTFLKSVQSVMIFPWPCSDYR